MRLRNLPLARKLILSFAIVVALLFASAGVTAWSLSRLSTLERNAGRTVVTTITSADDARAAAADMHFSQTAYALDGGGDARTDFLADRAVFRQRLRALGATAAT